MERGTLKCGVKGGQHGMGSKRSGQYSVDISYIHGHRGSELDVVQAGRAPRRREHRRLIHVTIWTTRADLDVDLVRTTGIVMVKDEFPNAELSWTWTLMSGAGIPDFFERTT